MNLSTKEIDGITVIELEGSVLGGPDASALNEVLHNLIEKKKKKVVVDLSDVQTMNSSGLSMLINALTTIRKAGGDLKIAEPPKKIESLLTITKLTTVFELFASVKEAIISFK
ncbi:MAG: STAS domain-containing protein [Bacteroidota bacterium]|nr:STAS domain-containing protein [Bacteroidota bacterium]